MTATVTVPARFCGPPDSGNGGYTSGLIAATTPWDAVTVTLRVPPPLDVAMTVKPGETVRVSHGDVLVAEAVEAAADAFAEPVEPGDPALAGPYPGLTHHPFPTCFTCGPLSATGLHLAPGRLPDGRTIASWRVPAEVDAPTMWAALDCPGGWVNDLEDNPRLLGRLTGQVTRIPQVGENCLVMGRLDGVSGRKATVTTTLYGADRSVLARARAVWISIAR